MPQQLNNDNTTLTQLRESALQAIRSFKAHGGFKQQLREGLMLDHFGPLPNATRDMLRAARRTRLLMAGAINDPLYTLVVQQLRAAKSKHEIDGIMLAAAWVERRLWLSKVRSTAGKTIARRVTNAFFNPHTALGRSILRKRAAEFVHSVNQFKGTV